MSEPAGLPREPLRVAVVQSCAGLDHAQNVAAAVAAIEQAADAGAGLVVLPEYAQAWAGTMEARYGAHHDDFVHALAGAARAREVRLVAGTLAPVGERLRNLALVIDSDGSVIAEYTKVHLFDAFGVRESDTFEAGAPGAGTVVEVAGWRIGVATCYDLRFPETFRVLADAGAHAFAVGAAWASGEGKVEQLEVLSRSRAIENTSYVLLASQSGRGRAGHSAILGPLGERIETAGADSPAVLVADLDPARLSEVRSQVPSLSHRRYAVIAKS